MFNDGYFVLLNCNEPLAAGQISIIHISTKKDKAVTVFKMVDKIAEL